MFALPVDIPTTEQNTVEVAQHQAVEFIQPTSLKLLKPKRKLKVSFSVYFEMDKYKTKYKIPALNPNGCYQVQGYASIEGNGLYNKELSLKRAQFISHLIKKQYPKITTSYFGNGENPYIGRKVIVREMPCEKR